MVTQWLQDFNIPVHKAIKAIINSYQGRQGVLFSNLEIKWIEMVAVILHLLREVNPQLQSLELKINTTNYT